MSLTRLLILPALAALFALALTASPASAVPPVACPCWLGGLPASNPLVCYVSPGSVTNAFAYVAPPPTFLQATGLWCRNNASFAWTSLSESAFCSRQLECLCAEGPGACACDTRLFASGGDSPGGNLFVVDEADASGTPLGDPTTGDERLGGIAFDAQGRLFGSMVIRADKNGPGTLIEIDPTDGSRLSTIGLIQDAGGANVRINDLATHPATDVLYGIDTNAVIWTIDKATGLATRVGPTGLVRGGLAFMPDGRLFLATAFIQGSVDPELLAEIDPADGSVLGTPVSMTDSVSGGGLSMDGLGARPDGVLFGTTADDDGLYRIDPASGVATHIGDADDTLSDLAFGCPFVP